MAEINYIEELSKYNKKIVDAALALVAASIKDYKKNFVDNQVPMVKDSLTNATLPRIAVSRHMLAYELISQGILTDSVSDNSDSRKYISERIRELL